MRRTLLSIIGCGNSNRSDDGVGVYVVQKLRCTDISRNGGVRIFDAGTGGMDVMFQARGSDALIVVDASQSGAPAGAIFEVPGDELESAPEASFNLHDFRWQHALFAGRKIFKDAFPKEVSVYLIEAENLALGLELSQVVKNAAELVVDKIIARVRHHEGQTVRIRGGSLYLDHSICSRFFAGIESVALLKHEKGFRVLPIFNQGFGGRLLKVRNSQGDRVVVATDFLRECGLIDEAETTYPAIWDSAASALYVDLKLAPCPTGA